MIYTLDEWNLFEHKNESETNQVAGCSLQIAFSHLPEIPVVSDQQQLANWFRL